MFAPDRLAAWSGGSWTAVPAAPVTGFAHDTRELRPGQLFVALKSERRDGHEFLAAAAAAGAAGALVGRAAPEIALPQLVVADPLAAFQAIAHEHRRAFSGPVIGISGSAGKTSTKDLCALLLGGAPDRAGDRGQSEQPDRRAADAHADRSGGAPVCGGGGRDQPARRDGAAGAHDRARSGDRHAGGAGAPPGSGRPRRRWRARRRGSPAAIRAAGVALFPRPCEQFGAFRDLAVRRMVVEPAEVLRPAAPPKDRVFFAVTQRDDTTAACHRLRAAAAAAFHAPPRLRRHGAERRAGHLRRAVARRAGPAHPGAAGGLAARALAGRTAAGGRAAGLRRLLQRQPGVDGRRAGELRIAGARRAAESLRAGLHGGAGSAGGGLSPPAGPHDASAPGRPPVHRRRPGRRRCARA